MMPTGNQICVRLKYVVYRESIFVIYMQTRHIDPMFDQYWADVVDGGQTLVQHLVNVSCLLGRNQYGLH